MKLKVSVAAAWKEFRRAEVAEGTCPLQVRALRRAFYSGAFAPLWFLSGKATAGELGEVGRDVMTLALVAECGEFFDGVERGEA